MRLRDCLSTRILSCRGARTDGDAVRRRGTHHQRCRLRGPWPLVRVRAGDALGGARLHRRPDERRWRRTQALDPDWTADLREFLEQFTGRTPGSFVEERSTGFAWHFGRMNRGTGDAQARELFAVLQEAGDAMGFTVTLKPSSIEVRPGELSRERTIEKILAADASAGRLVVFERPGKENGLRRVLRPSDVLVAIGAAAASSYYVLSSTRTVRDVLESAFETVGQDLEHARPDDRSFFSPAVSALPAVTTSLSVSPH